MKKHGGRFIEEELRRLDFKDYPAGAKNEQDEVNVNAKIIS